jgi:hypothetical protein
MHNYGILKREGISIDNSKLVVSNNLYDRDFVNSIAKYAKSWASITLVDNNTFVDGISYTISKNKFTPVEYNDKKPRILFIANNFTSYFPQYYVTPSFGDYILTAKDIKPGSELCIIHEDRLNVYMDGSLTVTRTFNLDNNMMASYVITKRDNQQIRLSEIL